MSALSAFLHPAVPTEEKELVISKRFLGADGKPVPFKIRALTQEENSSLLKASTRKKKVGQQWQDEMDANEYSSRMIVAATVFPDFHSAELCENYNTKDPGPGSPARCCCPVSSSNSSPPSTNCPAWMKARTKKQKTDRRGPLGY